MAKIIFCYNSHEFLCGGCIYNFCIVAVYTIPVWWLYIQFLYSGCIYNFCIVAVYTIPVWWLYIQFLYSGCIYNSCVVAVYTICMFNFELFTWCNPPN